MKELYTKNKGFTLAELLVVVAIIAVLVGVSIPIFSEQTTKAKKATDQANMRNANAAAVNEYLTNKNNTDMTYYYDAYNGTLKTSNDGIKGYGESTEEIEGATGVPNKNGTAHIVTVKVKTDGSCTLSWGSDLENYYDTTKDKLSNLENNTSIMSYQYNGELQSTEAPYQQVDKSIFNNFKIYADRDGSNTPLYWTPKTTSLNGKIVTYLYANESNSGNNNFQGFAVYYEGATYISTNIAWNKSIDKMGVQFDASGYLDFGTYLTSNRWKKVE